MSVYLVSVRRSSHLVYSSSFLTSARSSDFGLTPSAENKLFWDWRQLVMKQRSSQDLR